MTEKTECNCGACSCDDLTWNASGTCTPCEKGIHWTDEVVI
jgi:hypothetical protein